MTSPEIQISSDKAKLNIDFIHAELACKYWSIGIPRSIVETAIAHSLCFGVYLNESQIGFARVTSDVATFAYLSDVFILDQYQGQGYAKRLISEIQAHPQLQGLRRWMLMTQDAHSLYTQFGFKALAHPERAMEKNQPNIYQKQ
ncbi:GNAT family N-acetyltransferase [Solimicrobium silvestre]|uniref:Acetyltransferase (GNAT) family n=1 Tax=Solimicrobium silvestre TaxID=2099400 RepID=A0A2S9H1E6_9BURK|nr:GNAT family N-acetyltransferase [Solimicrobium silvestre]PRC93686.1 Acetyltransferase (GNAT) family [Solimicrobium silvestre]